MTYGFTTLARCASRGAVLAAAAVLFGCMQMLPANTRSVSSAAATAPPAGYGRIWVYRDYEPYVSLQTPPLRFNGQIVGISQPGVALYRDVAPGEYRVTVDSLGRDVNQFTTVAVAAGQQIYVKVEASRWWDCGGGGGNRGGGGGWCRTTFYTRLIPPQLAAPEMASSSIAKSG